MIMKFIEGSFEKKRNGRQTLLLLEIKIRVVLGFVPEDNLLLVYNLLRLLKSSIKKVRDFVTCV